MTNVSDLDAWAQSDDASLLDVRSQIHPSQHYLLRADPTTGVPTPALTRTAHIPIEELATKARMHELPGKTFPFALLGSSAGELEEVEAYLVERGWTVTYKFEESDAFWQEVSHSSNAVAMSRLKAKELVGSKILPLFRPCTFFRECLPIVEEALTSHAERLGADAPVALESSPKNRIWSVCDLGCGAGRDLVWLLSCWSRHDSKGSWRAFGVDNLASALSRLSDLARRHGVADLVSMARARIRQDGQVTVRELPAYVPSARERTSDGSTEATEACDPSARELTSDVTKEVTKVCGASARECASDGTTEVKAIDSSESSISDGKCADEAQAERQPIFTERQFELVCMIRFLERSLFPTMARMVSPGGCVLIYQFKVGAEAFGHPKDPRLLIRDQELATVFSEEIGFKILIDRTEHLPDGRPMVAFLAQKLRVSPK